MRISLIMNCKEQAILLETDITKYQMQQGSELKKYQKMKSNNKGPAWKGSPCVRSNIL
jgi:hypothetical protein